jgi:tetratricopeptide (TPR) repeat protein
MQQAEYERAFNTYGEGLKARPGAAELLDGRVDAAMRWAENFSVLTPEDGKPEVIAEPLIGKLIDVLDAGLARAGAGSKRAADILAHAGWAHWLNQHIAYKEFGSTAQDDLQRALQIDPHNVFANAMLGNILLQTHGAVEEALAHFRTADESGKERPLVRGMELGGMHYEDDPQLEAAMIRVANAMRKNGEALDDEYLSDLESKFDLRRLGRMKNAATAVSPDEAWATYEWIRNKQRSSTDYLKERMRRAYVHASILEANGRIPEAAALFKEVQREVSKPQAEGFLKSEVSAAVARTKG